ncbi:glyceraldehyde-3-phosphate dehydrogenase [Salipiger bermudensis]|nr:glyceraldehyde-3-phosphate dehydrogenase [Salipiger bermudensis]MCA0960762.1 glyceraldehyde-3-phosphate dehydrogenase [Salipiger bermudensis]
MTVLNSIYRRYAYRRALYTLQNLPERTRMDCDILGRETEVARRAVYGA